MAQKTWKRSSSLNFVERHCFTTEGGYKEELMFDIMNLRR